jgi:hypothetical protein
LLFFKEFLIGKSSIVFSLNMAPLSLALWSPSRFPISYVAHIIFSSIYLWPWQRYFHCFISLSCILDNLFASIFQFTDLRVCVCVCLIPHIKSVSSMRWGTTSISLWFDIWHRASDQ